MHVTTIKFINNINNEKEPILLIKRYEKSSQKSLLGAKASGKHR